MLTNCRFSNKLSASQLHTHGANGQRFPGFHQRLVVPPLRSVRSPQQPDEDGPNETRDIVIACQTVAASIVGGGLLAGAGFGLEEALPTSVQHLSATLGWGYFAVWSLSFYPQVIENWRRKSVNGLSADYLVYSILGYAAYTIYTAALYWSPGVQAAYIAAHAGSAPDVCLADFLFASHALVVSLITLYQCHLYSSNSSDGSSDSSSTSMLAISRTCQLTALGVVGAIVAYASHIGSTCGVDNCDAWLPLLFALGAAKVTMTLVKYTPQALLNAERRSTDGWQINNVLLDLAGGALSLAQIGLNAFARADLSVVTGNPAKIGISAISIGFDVLFILQHYVFYRQRRGIQAGGATSKELPESSVTYQRPAETSSGRSSQLGRRTTIVAVNATK